MTQIQFLAVWWRLRPRNFNRSKWFIAGCRIHAAFSNTLWSIRNPRFAWWCYRVRLHYRWGFPMPADWVHAIEV